MNSPEKQPFVVGGRSIGPSQPCFVIAEAGVNHNGDPELARQMIAVAARSGADAIKFQTFKTDRLVTSDAPKADYQMTTTDAQESMAHMLSALELSAETHRQVVSWCRDEGILFMSTPFDEESADLLDDLDVPLYKVPSGEVTNWPLLEHIGRKGKPIILSTGMSTVSEVDDAVRVIRTSGDPSLILLHCVSNYPCSAGSVNLRAMGSMAAAWGVPVGYSDHTMGIEVAVAAVALGACVVEKHFTLDREMLGPDHKASLEPEELALLVSSIRNVEEALGDGVKRPVVEEEATTDVARKSLVAAGPIPSNTVIRPDMLTVKRPGTGVHPRYLSTFVGKRVVKDVKEDELLGWDAITGGSTE
ncbi:N-acetylneuraminate synthase [bacterium]|nr:N-acetylneuraminate synthase [bacterium]